MKLARVFRSLSLAALAVAGPRLIAQANVTENQTTILYVDAQTGSDSNSGSSSAPLKTIQAAVNKANTNNTKSIGTRIVVNPGVYRETVKIDPVTGQTAAPLTLEAAKNGTAIIAASDLLTGWSTDPQYTGAYLANWIPAQSTCALPTGWPAVQPIGLHTEMLFVNSVPMTQVLDYSDLKPGTFFVDTSNGTVHMWPPAGVDPSSATVEVASRSKTISVVGRTNIVLRGLVFEHAASCINTSGATITSSTNVLVDAIQANWNNFGGLGLSSSSKVTVQNSIASYNGGVGFQGTKGQTTLYTNNETDYNNWRGAQAAFYNWASGGAKFFQMRTTSVQGHSSYNNQAQGLWFDTDNQNITISNATLVGSYDAALQLERNEGPITLENSHLCASGVGLNVLTTQGLTVNNNVFYNNGATNKYQAQIYLAGTAGGINITNWQTGQIYNLITTGTSMSGNAFIDSLPGQYVFGTYLSGTDWTDFTSTLKSGNNTWYDPNTASAFHIVNGKNVNLSGWQSATGADYSSTWQAPSTSPDSACAVPPPSYPDFNVSIDNGAYTMSSGRATAQVRVSSFNFGGTVNLSVSGLPAGVTASFSAPSLNNGFSVLTFAASSTSAAQTLPVTLWAVGGDRVHSVTFNLTVNANPSIISTTTSLSSSASSITEGSSVTLTATVNQASGTTAPTGTVSFYNGGSSLGTAALSGGKATLSISSLPTGTNSIAASYAGNSTFNASTSGAITVNVTANAVNTATSLSASAATINQGSPVTLTAHVQQASGSVTPTGTVIFYNGATAVGSASLSSGTASLTTSSLPLGSDSITATYSGASGFDSSTSSAVTVTVASGVVSTSTKLAASASTITQNSPVTLTAAVTQSTGTTTPTGTVTFYNGATTLGSAALNAGIASISTSSLPTGTDSISAAYSGAVAFNASSSNVVTVTVNAPPPSSVSTTTSLTVSAATVAQGTPVTIMATVKPASGTTLPGGTVTFTNGGAVLGTAQLVAGAASFTTSALPVGSELVTASYAGSSTFNASSSAAITITVKSAVISTATTLSASSSSIRENSPVTLTASVKPSSGTSLPNGSISFYNGTALIGSATLAAGSASLTTSSLPAGTDVITAAYAGTSTFSASTSVGLSIKVTQPVVATVTSLSVSSSSVTENTSITLNATVRQSIGTATPTGTVVFYDGSNPIGIASLTSGTASLSTSSLSVGLHRFTSTYEGTSGFAGSTSNAISVTVNASSTLSTSRTKTSTAISASTTQAQQGYTIALTAVVTGTAGSAVPTGSVEFIAGTTKLGSVTLSSGKAYLHTSALPVGMDAITATYSGDVLHAGSSSTAVVVMILGPDFRVEATPSSVTTTPGKSVTVNLRVTPMNGFNQNPEFRCVGLPAGSTCSFDSPVKQADGSSLVAMTLHTAAQTSTHENGASKAPFVVAMLPFLLFVSRKQRRALRKLISLSALLAVVVVLGTSAIGCGGRSTFAAPGTSGTTEITVTAQTSSGLSHTAIIKLVIQ